MSAEIKTRVTWLPEDDALLLKLLGERHSVLHIARAMNRSAAAIYHRKFRLGQSDGRRPFAAFSDETLIKRVVELYTEGWIYRDIMAKTGLSKDVVSRIIAKRVTVKRKKHELIGAKTYDEALIEQVRKLIYEDKLDQHQIATHLGIKRTTIRDLCISRGFSTSRKWTPQQHTTMMEMLEKGATILEIASAIGRSEGAVLTRANEMNLHTRFPQINEAHRKRNAGLPLERLLTKKLGSSKRICEIRGRLFDIDLAYLLELLHKQGGKCHYTGQVLTTIVNDPNQISIDRIDSGNGYVKGNIALCCVVVNSMKQDVQLSEFVRLCGLIHVRHQSILPPSSSVGVAA